MRAPESWGNDGCHAPGMLWSSELGVSWRHCWTPCSVTSSTEKITANISPLLFPKLKVGELLPWGLLLLMVWNCCCESRTLQQATLTSALHSQRHNCLRPDSAGEPSLQQNSKENSVSAILHILPTFCHLSRACHSFSSTWSFTHFLLARGRQRRLGALRKSRRKLPGLQDKEK